MKGNKIYIIGNWKCNKNTEEVTQWFTEYSNGKESSASDSVEQIVCPSFIHLELARNLATGTNLPVKIGAQDVSPFPQGAYTGEVAADQLKGIVEYVILGHSERRKYFHEDDELLKNKVKQASAQGIKTIYCVPDENTSIPDDVSIIAYEPIWAIGTGKADTPENANVVLGKICEKFPNTPVVYGGSVTPDNVLLYISQPNISGVLIGGASLDVKKFKQMVQTATER